MSDQGDGPSGELRPPWEGSQRAGPANAQPPIEGQPYPGAPPTGQPYAPYPPYPPGQPTAPHAPAGYAVPYAPSPPTNGMAIAALVCGVAGFVICPLIGIAAVICGFAARGQIRASGGMQSGEGMTLAGLILGAVDLGITALVLLAILAVTLLGRQADTGSSLGLALLHS